MGLQSFQQLHRTAVKLYLEIFWLQTSVSSICLENFLFIVDFQCSCLQTNLQTNFVMNERSRWFDLQSVSESQLLALQVKMFYGIQSALKFNLVRVFNNSPNTFKYMELVKEFENYKKDVENKKKSASSQTCNFPTFLAHLDVKAI